MIEVTIVIAILSVAVGLFAQTMTAAAKLDPVSEETRLAAEAARVQLEDMRALPFDQLFRSYNDDPSDDPGGPGSAPGAWFDVRGLHAPGSARGVGHVVFPVAGRALSEQVEDAPLGMPHDLNGDGVVDGNDHSADAIILPVRIQLEWSSSTGHLGRRELAFYDLFARL